MSTSQTQAKQQPQHGSQPPSYTSTMAKPTNKPVGSANAVADPNDKPDGCWAADFASEEDSEHASSWSGSDMEVWEAVHDASLSPGEWEDLELKYPESDAELPLPVESAGSMQATIAAVEEAKSTWVKLYDSGATRHLSPYHNNFITYWALEPPLYLNAANKQQFPALGTGSMVVNAPLGSATSSLTLENVLYAPAVGYTLISLGTLDVLGYHMGIEAGTLEISSPKGTLVTCILQTTRGLYCVMHKEGAYAVEVVSVMELHQRMGHIAPAIACRLVEDGLVTGLTLDPDSKEEHCDACIYARTTRQPVPKLRISEQASNFGDEVHTDVWGPAPVSTCHSCQFFITFTDDATRFTVTYLLPAKGDTLNAYRSFEAWACTQDLCTAIKVLRLDHGGEYLSTVFDKHLADAGTAHRLTVHDMPQLNSIAERLNRTLMEKVHVLLHTSGLLQNLWGKVLCHSTWLKNHTST